MSGEARNKRILLSVPHMGGREQEYVREAFASNWLSTLAGQEALHENAGRSMVRVTWVVKPDEETGVEDDHRRSPYTIPSISMLSCSLPGG